MVFSSLEFLYIFLPICLILYFLMPTLRWKNSLLIIASLIFYAWGEPLWIILLIFSTLVDYVNGRIIGAFRGTWKAKAALVSSVIINLALLGVFKYSGFIAENVAALFRLPPPDLHITLPIGISFYTFQTLSYTIDVYRDKVRVQKSFFDLLLFVSLFPQLIAGPILRYSELETQLIRRKSTLQGAMSGAVRFISGLGKKVLLANYAGAVAKTALGSGMADTPGLTVWLGVLMFAFQIYFDFSGYSDMAIGLGRIFGMDYSENFNYPYISRSVTEFWRRWHISLGSFFRDYLYIPLGGNRSMQIRNLLVVWFLTGLWHGASWNFVLWGLYFFVLLFLEKFVLGRIMERMPAPLSRISTFFFVLLGWVIFYFTDLRDVGGAFLSMFGFGTAPFFSDQSRIMILNNVLLITACAIASTPFARTLVSKLETLSAREDSVVAANIPGAAALLFCVSVLLICTVSLVGKSYNPFLYFRF